MIFNEVIIYKHMRNHTGILCTGTCAHTCTCTLALYRGLPMFSMLKNMGRFGCKASVNQELYTYLSDGPETIYVIVLTKYLQPLLCLEVYPEISGYTVIMVP